MKRSVDVIRKLGSELKRWQSNYTILSDMMQTNSIMFPQLSARDTVVDATVPRQLHIYSDLVRSHHVSDAFAGYLRSARVPPPIPSNGMTWYEPFGGSKIPYYAVDRHTYSQIEINITDETGAMPPFTTGTVSGTLHFKPAGSTAHVQGRAFRDALQSIQAQPSSGAYQPPAAKCIRR
jgi:hypothetical protein